MKRKTRTLFLLSFSSLVLTGYVPYQDRRYVDYFLHVFSADLFRQKSFTLDTVKVSYDTSRIKSIKLVYSSYHAYALNDAREMVVQVTNALLEAMNNDPELAARNLFNRGHFCLQDLDLEINVENLLSAMMDPSGIHSIHLQNGMITYTSFTTAILMPTGVKTTKESYREAVLLLSKESIQDFQSEFQDWRAQKREKEEFGEAKPKEAPKPKQEALLEQMPREVVREAPQPVRKTVSVEEINLLGSVPTAPAPETKVAPKVIQAEKVDLTPPKQEMPKESPRVEIVPQKVAQEPKVTPAPTQQEAPKEAPRAETVMPKEAPEQKVEPVPAQQQSMQEAPRVETVMPKEATEQKVELVPAQQQPVQEAPRAETVMPKEATEQKVEPVPAQQQSMQEAPRVETVMPKEATEQKVEQPQLQPQEAPQPPQDGQGTSFAPSMAGTSHADIELTPIEELVRAPGSIQAQDVAVADEKESGEPPQEGTPSVYEEDTKIDLKGPIACEEAPKVQEPVEEGNFFYRLWKRMWKNNEKTSEGTTIESEKQVDGVASERASVASVNELLEVEKRLLPQGGVQDKEVSSPQAEKKSDGLIGEGCESLDTKGPQEGKTSQEIPPDTAPAAQEEVPQPQLALPEQEAPQEPATLETLPAVQQQEEKLQEQEAPQETVKPETQPTTQQQEEKTQEQVVLPEQEAPQEAFKPQTTDQPAGESQSPKAGRGAPQEDTSGVQQTPFEAAMQAEWKKAFRVESLASESEEPEEQESMFHKFWNTIWGKSGKKQAEEKIACTQKNEAQEAQPEGQSHAPEITPSFTSLDILPGHSPVESSEHIDEEKQEEAKIACEEEPESSEPPVSQSIQQETAPTQAISPSFTSLDIFPGTGPSDSQKQEEAKGSTVTSDDEDAGYTPPADELPLGEPQDAEDSGTREPQNEAFPQQPAPEAPKLSVDNLLQLETMLLPKTVATDADASQPPEKDSETPKSDKEFFDKVSRLRVEALEEKSKEAPKKPQPDDDEELALGQKGIDLEEDLATDDESLDNLLQEAEALARELDVVPEENVQAQKVEPEQNNLGLSVPRAETSS